jgi:ABC-2 type transport system ATP-binding protein
MLLVGTPAPTGSPSPAVVQAECIPTPFSSDPIEEAEEMADRIGVISKGEIILVEDKALLMRKLGKKQLTLHLQNPLTAVPPPLAAYRLELSASGTQLVYTFDDQAEQTGIADLLRDLGGQGIDFKDLQTTQSSLEDIFVNLVRGRA